jgi:hypothetical protein
MIGPSVHVRLITSQHPYPMAALAVVAKRLLGDLGRVGHSTRDRHRAALRERLWTVVDRCAPRPAVRQWQRPTLPRAWNATESGATLRRQVRLQVLSAEDEHLLRATPRPRTRADCLEGGPNAARPCPFVSCRHHLGLEVQPKSGGVRELGGWMEDGLPSCALDVADQGEHSLERISRYVGTARERIRTIQEIAQARMKRRLTQGGLDRDAVREVLAEGA